MALSKGDFIELEYVGRLQDDNSVFDTTDANLAKSSHIFRQNGRYGPLTVVLGEKHLIPGLDAFLEGKDMGKYTVKLSTDQAFGRRNAQLLQLVPTKKFIAQKINPYPGMPVNIDGMDGVVRSTSSGRTIVDFNHPLSGKDVAYEVNIRRVVTDVNEKIKTLLVLQLSQKPEDVHVSVTGKVAQVGLKFEVPKEFGEVLEKEIKRLVKDVDSVTFTKNEAKK